jgi:hypothetical protein
MEENSPKQAAVNVLTCVSNSGKNHQLSQMKYKTLNVPSKYIAVGQF